MTSRTKDAVDFARAREQMVARDIEGRGVQDRLVLAAMRKVPREAFVPKELHELAYDDSPLPIGREQTISQPYMVAFMIEALQLRDGERVLEIGAGSGYAAAVLSEIASTVYTMERLTSLAAQASEALAAQGYVNVLVREGDGTRGWPEHAPYDGIVVAAGAPRVPQALMEQLAIGGRLVIPVGADTDTQQLVRVTRLSDDQFHEEETVGVRFVPLIGEHGWPAG
jgi:protein-L-isoaspartate(D-aspartate) O-methyltransferase